MTMERVRRLLPGLGLLLLLGLLARGVVSYLPVGSDLVVVIALGVLLANTVGIPDWASEGVGTYDRWLEAGIVLMGATIGLGQVLAVGDRVLLVVLLTVCATVLTVEFLSRVVFDVPEKVGSLLAAGSGICGVSAITAVAGGIKPDREEVAYAAATVLLFDAVTLAVYPVLGRLLDLSDVVFGVWAGATMFSTGPVTAAGFAHSQTAGEWAVIVKLARNVLIGAVAIGYATYYAGRGSAAATVGSKPRYLWRTFPKFVLGFVLLMLLGSVGVFSDPQTAAIGTASNWAFLLAFAGIGLSIDVGEFRDMGVEPVGVVLTTLVTVSTVVLLALLAFL
jgi:uncharacterized integral membrane protein (TIGR00698 family)